jgi:hypothetical protein
MKNPRQALTYSCKNCILILTFFSFLRVLSFGEHPVVMMRGRISGKRVDTPIELLDGV